MPLWSLTENARYCRINMYVVSEIKAPDRGCPAVLEGLDLLKHEKICLRILSCSFYFIVNHIEEEPLCACWKNEF